MKKTLMLAVVFVFILSMIACGGKQDEAQTKADGEKQVEEAVQAEKKIEKKASATENSLSFTTNDIDGTAFNLSHVEAVIHKMQANGQQYQAVILQLANYDRGGGSYHPSPTEDGQVRLTVNFSCPAGKELAVGKYGVDGAMGVDNLLSVGIEGKVNGSVKSIGLYNAEGGGEIVYIDDEKISGRLDLKDSKGTTIKASFTAPILKSPY